MHPITNSRGYRLVYEPDHPNAYTCSGYEGYIYEHILIAERLLGRHLIANEVVHHLDGNPLNNSPSNLLVLLNGQHAKLHAWIRSGAPGLESFRTDSGFGSNCNYPKASFCEVCGRTTCNNGKKRFCSPKCAGIGCRKVSRPTKEQLKIDIKNLSWVAVGRKYGVSDNAIRKWARQYNLLKAVPIKPR